MAYEVSFAPNAVRQFESLPRHAQVRLATKIEDLENDPRPSGAKKLAGEGELWRIRVGDYRVIYAIIDDQLVVLVVAVGDRKEVYRRGLP